MSDTPESTDLRLVGRSADGLHLDLSDTVGNKFSLRIGDTLRASVNQPRLTSVAPIDERPNYSVKDIQARLRSGESMDAISRTTDWPLEKIEKFAGPILQERAYIISQALKTPLHRDPSSQLLQEAMVAQLGSHGVDLEQVEWNTHRRNDGQWVIVLYYPSNDGQKQAQWIFDAARGLLTSDDDSAKWIGGEERDPRSMRAATPSHGLVFNHENAPAAPRLMAVKEEVVVERYERLEVVAEIEEVEEEISDEDMSLDESNLSQDEEDAAKDGVKSRPKLPSWDEIMFGSNPDKGSD
ncbi:MAG: DUF3071 domain-containing protein [Actinobacteria bacterium]|uniref:Unannotated protein n=1 Tax=freshwater metagenome TaxID=449393 RepID=A0A6J7L104_9ZZZZ|nr:DUF3071 domain-containing protein [Actinomycetota bacterium]MTA04668.1 DUF3071 domain-containing protein [Actinomycetota bacterium]